MIATCKRETANRSIMVKKNSLINRFRRVKKGLTDRDDLTETVPRRHNGDDVAYTIGIACVKYNPVGGEVV